MLSRVSRGIIRQIGSLASQSGQVLLHKSAVEKLSSLAKKRGIPVALRLSVDSGGCGGFSYSFNVVPETEISKEDEVFEESGQKLVVDSVSLSFLKECEIDYHEEMVRSSFRVTKNALADSSCGCGTSFSVSD
jgi:iron-sulfur cluster assembly accessory protein